MQFKNKNTGVILTTNNEFVIEQLKTSGQYEEVKESTRKKKVEE